jgi:FdhD protein
MPDAPPRPGSLHVFLRRREGASGRFEKDAVVVEEPLEVRVREGRDAEPVRLLVTMRTPGDDEDLAAGLVFSEGVVESAEEILDVSGLADPVVRAEISRNVVVVTVAPGDGAARALRRRAVSMSSACGVCGDVSIERVSELADAARRARKDSGGDGPVVPAAVLSGLPDELRRRQEIFRSTGGLHAAGLFGADGTLVVAREDVGRHNATDKAIGALLRERRPTPPILLVSGRLGFEIAQKAALAGVRIVCSVSAPTSLAVELSEETGMTVVGFLRGERFNVYCHPGRVG